MTHVPSVTMRSLVVVLVAVLASVAAADVREGANHHLGDDSFVARFGRQPSPVDTEHDRMHVHLHYVRELLASRPPTSPVLAGRRAELLGYLDDYIAAGITPRNTYVPWRSPVFIDADGRICAVGYLIERSVGRAVPEAIAAAHRLDYLEDIATAMPEVASWVASSGFTLDELASIQPGYEGPDVQHVAGWGADDLKAIADGPYHLDAGTLVIDGAFAKKEMTGPWKVTTEDGKLVGSGTFHRGAGTWKSVRLDGSAMAEGPFARNHAEGEWRFFHPSGHLAAIGEMHKGQRDGLWTFYYDAKTRVPMSSGRFTKGEVGGTWHHYDAKGTLVATSSGRPWKQPLYLAIEAQGGVRREVIQGEPASSHAIEVIAHGADKIYIRNGESLFDAHGNKLDLVNGAWVATGQCWKSARKRAAASGDVKALYELTSREEAVSPDAKPACAEKSTPVEAALGKRYDALLASRAVIHTPVPTVTFEDVSEAHDAAADVDDSSAAGTPDAEAQLIAAENGDDLANYLADHMRWYMEWPHVDNTFVAVYNTMPGYAKND